ncbi:MAG: AsmA family protein [Alphaproteobacteria bacterium]|nr:AsmA family protein [Alphaproteobacteria bacterium]
MGRILRFVLIVLAALVLLAVAAVYLIPADVYRGQIEAAAHSATGRELSIKGALGFTLYPAIGLKAEDVSFANAEGGRAKDMAQMDSLVVGLELFPLLAGEVRVAELVLDNPTINLELSRSGKPNWEFEGGGDGGAAAAPAPNGSTGGGPSDLTLGDVRLINGKVTYTDLKTGTTETLENIDATVALPNLDSPLSVAGSAVYKGETLNLDATVSRPRALMEAGATPVELSLSSALMNAAFKGDVDMGPGKVTGALDFKTDSVRKLAAWTGSAMPEGEGYGPMSAKGQLAAEGSTIRLAQATLSLDGMTGTGDVSVNTGGKVPEIKGVLALDRLNANPYISASDGGGRTPKDSGGGSGWSDEPIDTRALKALNADFTFTAGEVLFQKLKFGKSALGVVLKNGVLSANLREIALYGGGGKGEFTLDGSRGTPSLRSSASLDAIQALPLLTDAASMTWLEGLGIVSFDVSGSGASQRAIMRSLNGKGRVKFTDGAIIGVNLAQIARTIQSPMSGLQDSSQKTDFAELSGTFEIVNGVLTNLDMQLLNPFVRIAGKGVVDIGNQAMKYRIEPRAVGSIEGQGGKGDLSGVGIPFVIQGPWSNLTFMPDLEGLIDGSLQDALSGEGIKIPGVEGLTLPGQQRDEKPEEQKQEEEKPLIPGLPSIPGLPGGR